jgi:hypothetical protein
MPTIIYRRDRLDCSGGRLHYTHRGQFCPPSRRQRRARLDRRTRSHVTCHAALALVLLLAACAAPGAVGSSPYHAPNEDDLGHAGGGGGGAGGGM